MPYTVDDLLPIISRVRTDITAIKLPKKTSIWKRDEPLTSERIQAHLNGTCLRGVCPIKEGESTVMLAMLDLDSHKGETSWEEMTTIAESLYKEFLAHGIYFEGFKSSGGNGIHLYCIWDEPQDAYSVRETFKEILFSLGYKNGTGGVSKKEVEIFPKQDMVNMGHCGNQFILPLSPKGIPITEITWEVSEPVELRCKPLPPPKRYPIYNGRQDEEEALAALQCINPDVSYSVWVEIGMALQERFGNSGFDMWDAWSSHGSKYNSKEMWNKWQSFHNDGGITIATMFDHAKLAGWKRTPVEYPEIDTTLATQFLEKNLQKEQEKKEAEVAPPETESEFNPGYGTTFKFNFDPLALTGIIGDTVRDMNRLALYKQPELYLINTLVAAGAVFGRKYASPTDARTNLYMVGIARTAAGKDFSRQYISRLFESADLQEYLGAQYIRSDIGLLTALESHPAHIIHLDEIGMYMEAIASTRTPMHVRNISACLTRLFTCANNIYDHGATADTKSRIVIQRPHLCIYGTTTEETYANSLKLASISSGDLNRFLAYRSTRKFTGMEERPPSFEINNDVISAWNRFMPNGLLDISSTAPKPTIVEWDDQVYSMIQECMVKQNTILNNKTRTSELYGRYAELVMKISMILAISDNKLMPEFKPHHINIGKNIVDTCLEYMCHLADSSVSDSEYESMQQKILKYLRAKRNGASMTDLNNRFRSIKAKERREILADMIGQGVIEIIKEGGQKPRETVHAVR